MRSNYIHFKNWWNALNTFYMWAAFTPAVLISWGGEFIVTDSVDYVLEAFPELVIKVAQ